jgi:glucose-1-phosphate adenylyltransferase
MRRPKVLTVILAGGEGGRLELLTRRRAKPALPWAGSYRLIDFPLSNCVHSRLEDVWVLQQYQPYSLNDHLSNGRPWDLDRTRGGLRVLPPHTGTDEAGFHQGNADALWRNRDLIHEFGPQALLVLSADHVYKLDYGPVVDAHLQQGADVTVVTSQVPAGEASRLGVVEVDDGGVVTGFAYKADDPPTTRAATEVFVFDPEPLLATLDELAAEEQRAGEDDGDGEGEREVLKDLGHALLPRLVAAGRVVEHRLDGYWRDVGTVSSYWQSHMDLLAGRGPDLDDPDWPILTLGGVRGPARVAGSARIEDGLVSSGAAVAGTVARSVLGPGVVVEHGATVRDSVLLHDTVVRAGAVVEGAVVDRGVRVGRGAHVGDGADPDRLVLVGELAEIGEGASVPAGGRVDPGPRPSGG